MPSAGLLTFHRNFTAALVPFPLCPKRSEIPAFFLFYFFLWEMNFYRIEKKKKVVQFFYLSVKKRVEYKNEKNYKPIKSKTFSCYKYEHVINLDSRV